MEKLCAGLSLAIPASTATPPQPFGKHGDCSFFQNYWNPTGSPQRLPVLLLMGGPPPPLHTPQPVPASARLPPASPFSPPQASHHHSTRGLCPPFQSPLTPPCLSQSLSFPILFSWDTRGLTLPVYSMTSPLQDIRTAAHGAPFLGCRSELQLFREGVCVGGLFNLSGPRWPHFPNGGVSRPTHTRLWESARKITPGPLVGS